MSYCVNCGVELADSEKKCPLCSTEVINLNIKIPKEVKNPYPAFKTPEQHQAKVSTVVFLLTVIFLIPIALCLLTDSLTDNAISWSIYVVGALIFLYFSIIFPVIFRRKSPIIFLVIDTIFILLYTWLVEVMSSGEWFFTLGLPIALYGCCLVIFITALSCYTKASNLKLTGVSLILIGIYPVLIEFLLNVNFHLHSMLVWSLYPLITFSLIGVMLMIIDRNKELKEKLARKFFV